MENELKKLKKKLKEELDEEPEIDLDSDVPIHEKRVKEKKIREIFRE